MVDGTKKTIDAVTLALYRDLNTDPISPVFNVR